MGKFKDSTVIQQPDLPKPTIEKPRLVTPKNQSRRFHYRGLPSDFIDTSYVQLELAFDKIS